MAVIQKCRLPECDAEVKRYPSEVRRGVKTFCSPTCSGKYRALVRQGDLPVDKTDRKCCIESLKDEWRFRCGKCLRYVRPRRRGDEVVNSFGQTKQQEKQFFEEHGNQCGICGIDKCLTGRRLAIDHDHETGRLRGLLCMNCNTKLGWYEKNQASVRAYLDN